MINGGHNNYAMIMSLHNGYAGAMPTALVLQALVLGELWCYVALATV